MTTPEFNACLKDMQTHTVDVLTAKAAEYATDDRLHNFKAAAALERTDPVSALAGMMAKHTISVYDLVYDHSTGKAIPLELWSEKITDSINYLYLLWALLNEKDKPASASRQLTEEEAQDLFGAADTFFVEEQEKIIAAATADALATTRRKLMYDDMSAMELKDAVCILKIRQPNFASCRGCKMIREPVTIGKARFHFPCCPPLYAHDEPEFRRRAIKILEDNNEKK